MTCQAKIANRFCLSVLILGLMIAQESCDATDVHICDPSKQLDFRIMGDIEGWWRSESGDLEFHFDENGHLSAPKLGCGSDIYPLVPGDSNSFGGSKGQYGDMRLIEVKLGPGGFFLAFKEDFVDEGSTVRIHGRIVSPDVMHVQYFNRIFYVLHRVRPGDEEASTSGGDTSAGETCTSTTHEPMMGATSDSSTASTGDTALDHDFFGPHASSDTVTIDGRASD